MQSALLHLCFFCFLVNNLYPANNATGTINRDAAATNPSIIDGTNPPLDLRDLRDTSLRWAALIRAAHAAFNARVVRRAILSRTLRDAVFDLRMGHRGALRDLRDAVFDLRVGHRGALRDLRSPPIFGRTPIGGIAPNKSRPADADGGAAPGL